MTSSLTLLEELKKSSILMSALSGARTVLERELGLSNILLSTNESVKRELAKRGHNTYPYAYMALSDMQADRSRLAGRTIRRNGVLLGTAGATHATTHKGYIFPLKVSFEFKYIDDDPYRTLYVAETFALLSIASNLTFSMLVAGELELQSTIAVPESITIPIADTGNTTEPGGQEISIALVMDTYGGFIRDVSAVSTTIPVTSYDFGGN